ncbi:MAG: N-6 DNA methylase [Campylobacterota bacterium]|nr:N-6 DNA methylase [Campylobacterota bacterium]
MEKRDTEYIVREILKSLEFIHPNEMMNEDSVFEEQKSKKEKINILLSKSSKKGTNNKGFPEFICSKHNSDIILVIECKDDTSYLKSEDYTNQKNIQNYAVDGALWYGSFLQNDFNVFSIGIAGSTNEELEIESYFLPKKAKNNEHKFFNSTLFKFTEYEKFLKKEELIETIDESNLKKIANELNNLMRDEFKLSEEEKPLLISAIFLALKDNNFRVTYKNILNSLGLSALIDSTVSQTILNSDIDQNKKNALISKYTFLRTNNRLKSKIEWDSNDITILTAPLLYMVNKLNHECFKYIENNDIGLDIIGLFYSNFLKYTSSDGKGLGIVLTPQHITDLFCDLANNGKGLNPTKDIVYDPCAGTGGFLVSAMRNMINKSENDTDIIKDIKKNRIKGIESNGKMFALLSANMIVRGDGRSKILYGDCFEKENINIIQQDNKPTVGFMNPPYSQKKADESEYHFIENLLDTLSDNATGIVIVPISKACSLQKQDIKFKKSILKKHTLKAVMKMNIQLFGDNASTHTCIMVFEAHNKHNKNTSPVWLSNWSNDGFEVLKHRGRIMVNDWNEIKNQWLKDFRTKKEESSYSVNAYIDENDEWIVDAHIETDYSNLKVSNFEKSIRDFYAFKLQNPSLFKQE